MARDRDLCNSKSLASRILIRETGATLKIASLGICRGHRSARHRVTTIARWHLIMLYAVVPDAGGRLAARPGRAAGSGRRRDRDTARADREGADASRHCRVRHQPKQFDRSSLAPRTIGATLLVSFLLAPTATAPAMWKQWTQWLWSCANGYAWPRSSRASGSVSQPRPPATLALLPAKAQSC